METKTTRFLTQFSRAVFEKWTQTPGRVHFWDDEAFVHTIVEEAVAKLPYGKLKAQLSSDLKLLETRLVPLLRDLHADYIDKKMQDEKTTTQGPWTHGALLNEELTELELAEAARATCADKQHRVAGVLALDANIDVVQHSADTQVDTVERLVQLFTRIAARGYEAPLEQEHKRGLVLKRVAACAQSSIEELCPKSGNWSCREGDAAKQVQQLRALLDRVVVQDTMSLARVSHGESDGNLKAPWTMFYRPEESKELKKVSYDEEVAKIYGSLLTLAVYFPIENDMEEEETSDESASSEDEDEESTQKVHKSKQMSALAQAQLTTRQVLLAAQMRQRGLCQNFQWLVSVLSFLQNLHKPATYLDEDGDEALDSQDRCALLDCVGDVYTRVFSSATLFSQGKESTLDEKTAVQDRVLFEAVVCLRHAAHFMRVERKSSLPVITTAMAQLAGVPVPASFVRWLDYEQTTEPKSMWEKVALRLWKKCMDPSKMMNMLLSSTDVSDEEMLLVEKNYLEYLDRLAEGKIDRASRLADGNSSSFTTEAAEALALDAGGLFYMDNAGGDDKEKMSKSKRKRANKKKKRATSSAKRNRTDSN